jgi:hypothetical protein
MGAVGALFPSLRARRLIVFVPSRRFPPRYNSGERGGYLLLLLRLSAGISMRSILTFALLCAATIQASAQYPSQRLLR